MDPVIFWTITAAALVFASLAIGRALERRKIRRRAGATAATPGQFLPITGVCPICYGVGGTAFGHCPMCRGSGQPPDVSTLEADETEFLAVALSYYVKEMGLARDPVYQRLKAKEPQRAAALCKIPIAQKGATSR